MIKEKERKRKRKGKINGTFENRNRDKRHDIVFTATDLDTR